MHAVLTPSRMRRYAAFFHEMAQMLRSGMPVITALEIWAKSVKGAAFRRALDTVLRELRSGATLAESLRAAPGWLSPLDNALLEAGEKSGRLVECFEVLSQYYSDRAALVSEALSGLAYPALILAFAWLIFPLHLLQALVWQGAWKAFLAQKLGLLVPVLAAAWLAAFLAQSRRGETVRGLWELILEAIPLVSQARRSLLYARVLTALEALLEAGVPVDQAWLLAAEASGSPRLRRIVARAMARVREGVEPGEALAQEKAFPEMFLAQYRTGEISGRLDESLRYLRDYYQDRGRRLARELAVWTPRLIYLIVLGVGAYQVLSFWLGYYGRLLSP